MSTITKERVAGIASGEKCYTHDDVVELARIALASLEAEPVYQWRPIYEGEDSWNDCTKAQYDEFSPAPDCALRTLYTAPPAPVSVPDENGLFPCPFCGGRPEEDAGGCSEYDGHEHQDYSINCKSCGAEVYCAVGSFEKADISCSCHHNAREVCVEKWNRRATMLQGSDGNSPVIPDGWVACSERMPENDDFVYIWPRPDFGVELHVAQYGKFDKRDAGWYAQVYEQNYGIEYYPVKVTHWMPLPAEPQQEVK